MAYSGMSDPGHGGFDPGACGDGLRECDLTWGFGTKFFAAMERCGVNMYLTRGQNSTATNNQNAELGYRCQLANQKGVSFYIAFHINSGGGAGFESYHYKGNDTETVRLHQLIHGQVAKIFMVSGMPDRGMKTADFAVLRDTHMPSILLELGFIDNAMDVQYIPCDDFQIKVADAVARGVCQWLGIPYVEGGPVEIPATVNGTVTKAIMANGNTHLIWRFLLAIGMREGKEFTFEFSSPVDVKFKVLGLDVPAIVYKGDSYLQWNKIPGILEPHQRADGGWDFTIPLYTIPSDPVNPPPVEPQPTETPPPIPEWKKQIHDECLARGLITQDWSAKLDEPAPVWFVLAIAQRLMNRQ